MPAQEELQREILQLNQAIETNQAAMRLSTVSETDKARLLLALDRRKARLVVLREQFAALSGQTRTPISLLSNIRCPLSDGNSPNN
jgi:hypothetical protein